MNLDLRSATIFFALAFCVALIYSKFVLTVCMIGWLALAILSRVQKQPIAKDSIWTFLALSIPLILVLFGLFYGELTAYWWERLRIKSAFLVLPLSFFVLPRLTKRQYALIHQWFLGIVTISAILVTGHYLQNWTELTDALYRGTPLPTPTNHIRYSLMVGYAIIAGGVLWQQKHVWKKSWERWLILACTIFLFFFLHLLAVRSGILIFYLSVFTILIGVGIFHQRWALLFSILGICILAGGLSYAFIPSLKAKIDYTLYDWDNFQHDRIATFSDAERLTSLKVGWQIVKMHPITGIGPGQLRAEVEQRYQSQFPDLQPKRPHNQYLSIWVANGLIGLGMFLIAFFYPLWQKIRSDWQNPYLFLFVTFYLILALSFLVENTIENAVGVAFSLFFLLLYLATDFEED